MSSSFTPSAHGVAASERISMMPAQLTSTSIGPRVATMASTCAGSVSGLERSQTAASAGGPISLAVAAALSGGAGSGRVVCIVSGGNIDASTLSTILTGARTARITKALVYDEQAAASASAWGPRAAGSSPS